MAVYQELYSLLFKNVVSIKELYDRIIWNTLVVISANS